MAAGIYNFTLEQGTTFIRIFNYKDTNGNPINLSEASVSMQIRTHVEASSPVEGGTFTNNNGFTISAPAGSPSSSQFTLIIPATTSSAFTFDRAVYDIELLDSNNITTRLLQGKIKLSKEVTR